MATKVGSPAKRRPRTATPRSGRVRAGERARRRAGLRGVDRDEELVADARQLAGDHDLRRRARPRRSGSRRRSPRRCRGCATTRPARRPPAARSRRRRGSARWYWRPTRSTGCARPRRAERGDAPVGRARRVEGVRVEGAERPEAGQRLVALEDLRVEVARVRRARVRRPEHRLAQVAVVAAPALRRPGTAAGSPRVRRTPAPSRSRCTGCRA